MKNVLSCKKTAIILLIVAIVSVGFYAYMLARPISYGMSYYNQTEYDGGVFEGTMKFHSDGTMVIYGIDDRFARYQSCFKKERLIH